MSSQTNNTHSNLSIGSGAFKMEQVAEPDNLANQNIPERANVDAIQELSRDRSCCASLCSSKKKKIIIVAIIAVLAIAAITIPLAVVFGSVNVKINPKIDTFSIKFMDKQKFINFKDVPKLSGSGYQTIAKTQKNSYVNDPYSDFTIKKTSVQNQFSVYVNPLSIMNINPDGTLSESQEQSKKGNRSWLDEYNSNPTLFHSKFVEKFKNLIKQNQKIVVNGVEDMLLVNIEYDYNSQSFKVAVYDEELQPRKEQSKEEGQDNNGGAKTKEQTISEKTNQKLDKACLNLVNSIKEGLDALKTKSKEMQDEQKLWVQTLQKRSQSDSPLNALEDCLANSMKTFLCPVGAVSALVPGFKDPNSSEDIVTSFVTVFKIAAT